MTQTGQISNSEKKVKKMDLGVEKVDKLGSSGSKKHEKRLKGPDEGVLSHKSGGILDEEKFIEKINILKNEWIEIAIDDFWKWYSNVDRIIKFKPNFVKISWTLIKKIDFLENNEKQFIKEFIKNLKEKWIKIVAEFIEDKKSFENLKKIWIDFFQWYYFSEPSYEKK